MAEQLNNKSLTMAEGLSEAAKSDDIVKYLKDWIAKDARVFTILGYAMNPNYKMLLPEGTPPYRKSAAPMGLAEIELLHLHNKLYILYNPESPQYKKEEIFIGWLEKMNPTEADLLIAIKDKRLHKVFKKVSEYKIVEALGWPAEQYKQMKDKANAKGN